MLKRILAIGITALALTACAAQSDVGTLETIQADIIGTLPEVKHVSANELQSMMSTSGPDILVLDTRPLTEYNVSHIKGALQIDPDITPQYLSAHIGEAAAGKTVIVYCSVGWRSSLAAQRLNNSLIAS